MNYIICTAQLELAIEEIKVQQNAEMNTKHRLVTVRLRERLREVTIISNYIGRNLEGVLDMELYGFVAS